MTTVEAERPPADDSQSGRAGKGEISGQSTGGPAGRHLDLAGLVALGLVALLMVNSLPVPIPDTHTGTGASATAEVNDWVSVGHTFRMDRDGLCRVDVAMSTLKATNASNVQFYIRTQPTGPNLRTVHVRLPEIPEGKALDLYHTRFQDLPWVSFEFEPLYGYAGKELYFNLEGKEIDRPNTVQALFAYPNGYGRGEAYTSEKPAGASMVFRTYSRGTLSDLFGMTFPLLAKGKPGFLGWEGMYRGLAVAGAALLALLFATIAGLGRQEAHQ